MEHAQELTLVPADGVATPGTAVPVSQAARARAILMPQDGAGHCSCGGGGNPDALQAAPYPPVYAIGRIEWRFPSMAVEKEFAQAAGRSTTTGMTDRQALHEVLSQRHNRYLVRRLGWVLTIQGLETYLLTPRDSADYDLLVEAVRPAPSPADLDVVIGVRGPIAAPDMCNGLMLPIVVFDQLYSFDRMALMQAIPKPATLTEEQFTPAAEELFDRILQLADNAGAIDEHRALNYCAMRYPAMYATATEAYGRNCALTSVDVRPSQLSQTRKIVEVVFSFTHRKTDVVEKYFVRVDATEEFPYLVTKMSPYLDR